eukprot:TRINITY_DN9743_c0_g1_i1.p1 TRINITY_DN9743_c0_g1~~TRINITY_DN9743_c0_g1_i1.p1  ORF type:complete len:698 (-),score=123.46 TRINITY_DN9743_c0_g1_i1:32-2125(-)
MEQESTKLAIIDPNILTKLCDELYQNLVIFRKLLTDEDQYSTLSSVTENNAENYVFVVQSKIQRIGYFVQQYLICLDSTKFGALTMNGMKFLEHISHLFHTLVGVQNQGYDQSENEILELQELAHASGREFARNITLEPIHSRPTFNLEPLVFPDKKINSNEQSPNTEQLSSLANSMEYRIQSPVNKKIITPRGAISPSWDKNSSTINCLSTAIISQSALKSLKSPSTERPQSDREKRPKSDFSREKLEILGELILSEKKYLKKLKTLIECYMKPASSKRMASHDTFQEIFEGIEDIYAMTGSFCRELDKTVSKRLCVGPSFLRMINNRTYKNYLSTFQERIMKLQTIKKKSWEILQKLAGVGHGLLYLLIIPFNRLVLYEHYLKLMLINTEAQDNDYPLILDSLKKMLNLCQTLGRENGLNFLKYYVQNWICIPSINEDFCDPHRRFIRDGIVEINRTDWKKSKTGTLYLFNDVILISSTKKKSLGRSENFADDIIPIRDCSIKNISGDQSSNDKKEEEHFLIIDIDNVHYSYAIAFNIEEEKDSWYEDVMLQEKELKEEIIDAQIASLMEGSDWGNFSTSQLQVLLLAGKNILRHIYDSPNIAVRLRLGTTEKISEVGICRINPQWSEDPYMFRIHDLYREKLSVLVYDQISNENLGYCDIELYHLYEGVERRQWFSLENSNGSIYLGLTIGTFS